MSSHVECCPAHIELCIRMFQHALWADQTQNRRSSEVKEALKFFFTDREIECAIADIIGKPRPTLETRSDTPRKPCPVCDSTSGHAWNCALNQV